MLKSKNDTSNVRPMMKSSDFSDLTYAGQKSNVTFDSKGFLVR
jgi:hypothetical protein